MKKILIVVLAAISLFSMVACSNKDAEKGISAGLNDTTEAGVYADYGDKDTRDEALYRAEFISQMLNEPAELARFLLAMGVLNEFVAVDTENDAKTIENAVALFAENEEIHQQALERAKGLYATVHIDADWASLREVAPRSDD